MLSPSFEEPATPIALQGGSRCSSTMDSRSREEKESINATLQSDDYEYFTSNEALFGRRTCGVVCALSDEEEPEE